MNREQIQSMASLAQHPGFSALRAFFAHELEQAQNKLEHGTTLDELKRAQGTAQAYRSLLQLFDVEIPAVLGTATGTETLPIG